MWYMKYSIVTIVLLLLLFALVGSGCNNRMDSLNKSHLFVTVLETEKFKIKAPADSLSGEGLLPGSQIAVFL